MTFVKQYHTESALADTTTNREWQLVVQQLLVEVKFLALFLAFYLQLAQQALLVYTYTHARQLETASQHWIPDEYVAIQSFASVLSHGAPIVVVRSASVVLLAIAQLTSDTNHKYGTVLLTDGILALFWRLVGIHLQQFLSVYKVYLLGQERLYLRISLAGKILRATDGGIYALYYVLQECQCAVFLAYHGLPVPLVYIQRVQVVKLLVGTYGVHIGIDTVSWLNFILSQTQSFPLSQRVNHLCLCVAQILDGEAHGALHTVQIVVNTQSLQHEEWRSYAAQSQFCR